MPPYGNDPTERADIGHEHLNPLRRECLRVVCSLVCECMLGQQETRSCRITNVAKNRMNDLARAREYELDSSRDHTEEGVLPRPRAHEEPTAACTENAWPAHGMLENAWPAHGMLASEQITMQTQQDDANTVMHHTCIMCTVQRSSRTVRKMPRTPTALCIKDV